MAADSAAERWLAVVRTTAEADFTEVAVSVAAIGKD
jgi:hypothetical protein